MLIISTDLMMSVLHVIQSIDRKAWCKTTVSFRRNVLSQSVLTLRFIDAVELMAIISVGIGLATVIAAITTLIFLAAAGVKLPLQKPCLWLQTCNCSCKRALYCSGKLLAAVTPEFLERPPVH